MFGEQGGKQQHGRLGEQLFVGFGTFEKKTLYKDLQLCFSLHTQDLHLQFCSHEMIEYLV